MGTKLLHRQLPQEVRGLQLHPRVMPLPQALRGQGMLAQRALLLGSVGASSASVPASAGAELGSQTARIRTCKLIKIQCIPKPVFSAVRNLTEFYLVLSLQAVTGPLFVSKRTQGAGPPSPKRAPLPAKYNRSLNMARAFWLVVLVSWAVQAWAECREFLRFGRQAFPASARAPKAEPLLSHSCWVQWAWNVRRV